MHTERRGHMKKSGVGIFVLLAGLILVLGFHVQPLMAAEKELKIGGDFGLSGPGSESFGRIYDGVKAAAAWINDKGGITIKGDKYLLKVIGEDCKMSPDGMIAAVNKLVFEDKVKFMIQGVPIPPFKAAMIKILEDNKVLSMQVDGIGVNSEFSPQISYAFGTMTSRAIYDAAWADFVKFYPKSKRVAIVPPEDPATVEDAKHLGDAAKAHGLQVVAEEHYPFGTADFYPLWTKVLAAKPDVVAAAAGLPEWVGGIVKQGRELGFKGPFCFLTQGADPNIIVKIAGSKYATDIFTTSFGYSSPKMPPMVQEMARLIKEKVGVEMTADSFLGFDTLWMLAQAIEHAQSVDPTVVRDSFDKITKIDTPTGPGKIGGLKTYGVKHIILKPIPAIRIMNGKIEVVGWVEPVLP
jgi:branched-chain amino acid transport system substrate-binding protein